MALFGRSAVDHASAAQSPLTKNASLGNGAFQQWVSDHTRRTFHLFVGALLTIGTSVVGKLPHVGADRSAELVIDSGVGCGGDHRHFLLSAMAVAVQRGEP